MENKIKLHFIKSKHIKVIAKINNVKGWFIIDTGASNTFIEQTFIEKFKLKNINVKIKAQEQVQIVLMQKFIKIIL